MSGDTVQWIDHAGFWLKINGKNIYIDPFGLTKRYEHADAILISHPHSDHLSPDDIRKIADSGTKIYVPKDSTDKIPVGDVIGVEPDTKYSFQGVDFRTVPAYNKVEQRLHYHPRANGWVGYLVKVGDKQLYHAGDTDFIDEMSRISTNIALLPIGGTYVMTVEEAIRAAHAIKAEQYSPIHYRRLLGKEGSRAAEEKFKAGIKGAKILDQLEEQRFSF